MKFTRITLLGLALLFVVGITAGSALAATPDADPGADPFDKWWNDGQLASLLQLDAATIEKLDALYLEHGKIILDRKAALEKNRMDVFACMEKDPVDEDQARKEYKEVLQDRSAYYMARFDYVLAVRKVIGKERYMRLFDYFTKKWGK